VPHAHELLDAAAGLGLLVTFVWVAGSGLARRREAVERLAFGILAVLAAGWTAMLQAPIGVAALSHPWLLRLVGAAALAASIARPHRELRPPRPAAFPLLAAAAVSFLLAWPLLRTPSHGLGGGDMLWHLGWIRQLTGGLTAPGGVYAGVPNAYPWLYHSLVACLGQTLPGGLPAAFLVLQGFGTGALAVGVWLLSRTLGVCRAASTWTVVIALGGGGFGWLYAHRIAASPNMNDHARRLFHGDLVLSPAPTPALGNVPPLLPRDLGIALVPLVVWFGVTALRERGRGVELAAGAMVGFLGLLAPVAAIFVVGTLGAAAIAVRRLPLTAIVAAGLATLVWVVPFLRDVHRLGGLSSITKARPLSPDGVDSLVILGLVLPLAVVGVVAARRTQAIDHRLGGAMLAVSLLTLALAAVLQGDATLAMPALERGVRYLPAAALGLAFPAGLGAHAMTCARPMLRIPVAAVLAALLLASATQASAWQARNLARRSGSDSFACFNGRRVSPHDTVAALHTATGLQVFAQTGAHLLYLPRPRIRFAAMPTRFPDQLQRRGWQAALERGDPPPESVGWVFGPPRSERFAWEEPVASCHVDGHRYVLSRVDEG
jgi:hypothetical protein